MTFKFFKKIRCGRKSSHRQIEIRTHQFAANHSQEEPNWLWRVRNTLWGENAKLLQGKETYEAIQPGTKTTDDVNTLPVIYEETQNRNAIDKSTQRKGSTVFPSRMLPSKNQEESNKQNTYAMVEMRMNSAK